MHACMHTYIHTYSEKLSALVCLLYKIIIALT